jgi:hypothetical protein
MRSNTEITAVLDHIADFLEVKGESQFRVRAYRRGAELLLSIDAEYREKASRDELKRISPRRFNPKGEAWLPSWRLSWETGGLPCSSPIRRRRTSRVKPLSGSLSTIRETVLKAKVPWSREGGAISKENGWYGAESSSAADTILQRARGIEQEYRTL